MQKKMVMTVSCRSTVERTERVSSACRSTVEHLSFVTRELAEVLSHFGTGSLTMKIASGAGPCSFQTDTDENYAVIAMPEITEPPAAE